MQQQKLILSEVPIEELADLIAKILDARLSVKQPPPDPKIIDEIFHGDEALAKYLGTTTQTIWKLKRENKLPFHRFGRRYIYYASEIKSASFNDHKFGKTSSAKKG